MNRRRMLFGVAAGLASAAGCIQTSSIGSSPDGTESRTEIETGRSRTAIPTARSSVGYRGIFVRSRYDQPQAVLTIGNRSDPRSRYRGAKPHEVLVWNDANLTRTVTVEFADHSEQYVLEPDAYLRVYVAKPSDLVVSVSTENGTEETTVQVPPRLIDCNDSVMEVAVRENGTMKTVGASSSAGCGIVTPNTSTEDDSVPTEKHPHDARLYPIEEM